MDGRIPRWTVLLAGLLFGNSWLTACAVVGGGGAARSAPPTSTSRPVAGVGDATTVVDPNEPNHLDTRAWRTDFTKRIVSFREIQSGGPPKDGIPPIDRPKFVPADEAATWLSDREPVAVVESGDVARAYPLQILIWHEIVNDTINGLPVVVTFCPLCNTTITFDRRLDWLILDFGTTGQLRHSDLIMYDRQTETWWQQATGEAITGELTGKKLATLPSLVSSFGDFRKTFGGEVLSRDTGFTRTYGANPYVGYDDLDNPSPFLFAGKPDGRLRAMERVVAVTLDGVDVAYPFSVLVSQHVIHDTVGQAPIVIFFRPGTASALDQGRIADSRDVGSTSVFLATLDGRRLTFQVEGEEFVDVATGSHWTLFGQAIAGPLQGKQLTPVVHGNHFWFAWSAFKPGTRVYTAE